MFVRRFCKVFGSAFAIGLLACGTSAYAVTMTATLQGTIQLALDPLAYPVGEQFTLSFEYDPDIAGSLHTADIGLDTAAGGLSTAPFIVSPIRRVTFSMPGLAYSETIAVPSDCSNNACDGYEGVVSSSTDGVNSSFFLSLSVGDNNPFMRSVSLQLDGLASDIPLSLYTAFSILGTGNLGGVLTFSENGEFTNLIALGGSSLVVSNPQLSPVPLPAGLPLLASGLAGAAIMSRRKKSAKV